MDEKSLMEEILGIRSKKDSEKGRKSSQAKGFAG